LPKILPYARILIVIFFTISAEGEAAISRENPDLILLDIMMQEPDDGIALAQKLSREGVLIPVVMLSGVSTVTGYDYGKDDDVLPCRDFLQKPINPETLIQKVAEILG